MFSGFSQRTGEHLFCVIYEIKVKAGKEQEFRAAWHKVTLDVINECGSFGARLHKGDNGTFIAYAQWPDRASWEQGHKVVEMESLQLHVDDFLDGIPAVLFSLTVVEDLLVF